MTYLSLHASRDDGGPQIVRAPRSTDALGYALRGAFDGSMALPSDMLAMLRTLDSALPRRH